MKYIILKIIHRMPTSDTSQSTRTKLLLGKELDTYHRLNLYSPQGGRNPFSQIDLVYKTVGKEIGGCCPSTSAASRPAPTPAPAPAPAPSPPTTIKDCGSFTGAVTIPSIYFSGSRSVTRDTTNNTLTIIIPTSYSNNGSPYGTGNGPIDSSHSGNLISSYATATISQVGGVYQMDIVYTTTYTGGTYTQTATLTLGSTYWPTGQTISSVTYGTSNFIAAFQFDTTGTNINVSGGCFGGASYSSGITTQNSVVAFYINFSNGTSTRVALGSQFRWSGTSNTYTYVFNYTRAELANGPTPSPITGPFTPSSSTGVNTPNV
jgi:hypothetical protein